MLSTDNLKNQIGTVGNQDDPANKQRKGQSHCKEKCGENYAVFAYRNHSHGAGKLSSGTGAKSNDIRSTP